MKQSFKSRHRIATGVTSGQMEETNPTQVQYVIPDATYVSFIGKKIFHFCMKVLHMLDFARNSRTRYIA